MVKTTTKLHQLNLYLKNAFFNFKNGLAFVYGGIVKIVQCGLDVA